MPRSLAAALALLLLAGCDDPAETVREVVDARGNCSEDSLRVSSETCVRMFEKYAEMVAGGIHTYIGGMKAMDRAIQRLPPANFDTAGLGRAITVPRDGIAGDPVAPRLAPASRPPQHFEPPYDELPPAGGVGWYDGYGAGDYSRDPRAPLYGHPPAREQAPAPAQPAPRRGVLLPPDARLRRPWLGERQPERYPGDYDRRSERHPGEYGPEPERYPGESDRRPERYPGEYVEERREDERR